MELAIDEGNLKAILDNITRGEPINFAGQIRGDTLHLQETYSGGSVFWSLSKCLGGKSTGYVEYTKDGIVLHGVADKHHYEIILQ